MQATDSGVPAEQVGSFTIREYLLIASRNRWVIAGSIALSLTLALVYYLVATKYYQSNALIVTEGQRGINSLIDKSGKADPEENFDQVLFFIQRQIISQDFLGEVAKEVGLYIDGLDEEGQADALRELASNTSIQRLKMDAAAGFSSSTFIEGFVVSFLDQDPNTAMKVTARIAEKFIEENNKEREREVEGTGEFLDEELRFLKSELEKKEESISRFKKSHMSDLPQQSDANIRALDRVEGEVTTTSENLQRQSDKLTMLNQAVQQYRVSGQQSLSFGTARLGEPDPLFRRLKELRENLVKLRAEFWDGYPEIVLTKEEIRQVEEELTNLYGRDAIRPDKAALLDPYLQDLMKQQGEVRAEIALLQHRLEQLQVSKRDLEKRLEKSPQVEQELLVLERDYNNMKSNYAMLLDKRLHARIAENIEKRQVQGKFRILDRASFPRAPVVPNKLKVLVLGLLFGCASGAGLAILRERLTPQFRAPEDVELLLAGPRLLAAIPDFSSLWRSGSDSQNLQGSYLLRRPLGMALRSQPEAMPNNPPLDNRPSFREVDRRFVTKMFPRSMAAEQYRVAAARLQLFNPTGAPMVAAVTSAIKGEGKTTTVVNLGYTLSRDFGRRVLLVDCDFIFPELKAFIETPIRYGLVDCLRSDTPPQQAMSPFTDVPCWIMPAGEGVGDSNELLRAGQLNRVLSQLREEFDYILLNAPPILPVATMNVLESHSDFLLLVVRANLTATQAVTQALGSLRASKPIHVILNGVAANSLPSYMLDYGASESRVAV
ncbi:MAG: Wzz/FepE/Etk N-terminal domain-containing protein [Nitrospira sp.]|nr:Wzz/FepE/Etk N-terminal domain-containing protein [Nitrospira sp.]MDH4244125.1 Wzz/FepE/Etk N-terminal domain-containing protein [Nitrospira sp.]MDH4355983.1 Wzz/FepE/Etk N-terminal domain-containing protein [Nitrospira sp.]MDH5317783.1 Wzz/FepE/Etk N-terminal domain-containing protein [Nitrospira sp.]